MYTISHNSTQRYKPYNIYNTLQLFYTTTKQYTTLQNYTQLYKPLHNYTQLYTSQTYKTFQTLQNLTELYNTFFFAKLCKQLLKTFAPFLLKKKHTRNYTQL